VDDPHEHLAVRAAAVLMVVVPALSCLPRDARRTPIL
jgi:hypothetical protein